MAYTIIFVAGLLVSSASVLATPFHEACLKDLFGSASDKAPVTPMDRMTARLAEAQFKRVGGSKLFQYEGSRLMAQLIPCSKKGAEIQFLVDFLPPLQALQADPLGRIEALIPNGAAGGSSLASQKPHIFFIFAPDERGRKRHLVLSIDGASSFETPYFAFNRMTCMRIQFQEHCQPLARLLSVGFQPVKDAPGFYEYDLLAGKTGKKKPNRSLSIIAEIRNDKLVRLMRPLKFTAETDPERAFDLVKFEVTKDWVHAELRGHLFTRELRFNSSGSEFVSLRLNPEFDIATGSMQRFAEFLGYEEFIRLRQASGFLPGAESSTEFLENLKPNTKINDVRIADAEETARQSGLLADNKTLRASLVEADTKIVGERKSTHIKMAFPVMAAVTLAHNNWGRVFCYNGKQFKVDVAEADHDMRAPFHPSLGTFSKILTVTNLSTKKTLVLPEVLALTILDGFYGQVDAAELADFF